MDIVLECSGHFNSVEKATKHLEAGARFVIVSAPCKDCKNTLIRGVNDETIDQMIKENQNEEQNAETRILSLGSCTTNACIPLLEPLQKKIGIEQGFITTVHSYTNDQRLLDGTHKDKRRARAAANSIIPTSTGVSKMISKILPDLAGKIEAAAIRVPTPNVSLIDFTFSAARITTAEEIVKVLKEKADQEPGIIGLTDEELVSIDFNHSTYSTILDVKETKVIENKFVRLLTWYDNEWGFVSRMVEAVTKLAEKMQ